MKTQQHVYYIGPVEYYDKVGNDSISKNIAGEYTSNFEFPPFCARITFHKGSDMAMEQIDFMREMREKKQQVPRYQKPSIVLLSGYPGSGKTEVAREISKNLGFYLLSNDYVRNAYYRFTTDYGEEQKKKIDQKVHVINRKRLRTLLLSRTSFVYDKDIHKKGELELFRLLSSILHFYLITIRVQSEDAKNVERILSRTMDYEKQIPGVIGDSVEYLSPFPESEYEQIQLRKPRLLEDWKFDYELHSDTSIPLEDQIGELISSMRTQYCKRK